MSFEFFRHKRARNGVLILSTLAYAGTLMLSACGGGSSDTSVAPSATASAASRLPASGLPRMFTAAHLSGAQSANTIAVTGSASATGGTVQLRLPTDAQTSTLAVTINGHGIGAKFNPTPCSGAICLTADVTTADGYAAVKNVVSASVRNTSGGMASGRARFAATGTVVAAKASIAAAPRVPGATTAQVAAASADVCDTTTMCPPFLPRSVTFNTVHAGGWDPTAGAWFQVNGQSYPTVPAPATCNGAHYVAVLLDVQTLQEKTGGFEQSPRCFANGSALKGFLDAIPFAGNDLVITGTLWGENATSDLDTTTIGGTSYVNAKVMPLGYLAIGSGQQALGTAYENYYDGAGTDPAFNTYAYGTLQEDSNGNYNFRSSDVVEYAVSPNDPGTFTGSPGSVIAMSVPPRYSLLGETRRVFTAPQAYPFNGLWMLVLDRMTLLPVTSGNCPVSISDKVMSSSCGKVYVSHGEDANGQDAMWSQFATDLAAVNKYQLVFLVSNGVVGLLDQQTTYMNSFQGKTGFRNFAKQLAAIGGDASLVAGPTYTSNSDTFAMVGFPGAGNPLAGGAVESSTNLGAFGQSGVLHGLLKRNQNGLYLPGQVSQEPLPLFTSKGSLDDSDFVLAQQVYSQPTEWPSNSATTLLTGASSIDGQRAAYRFLSHWLLAGYYIKGISGAHQDDLHYFFSGSFNTAIDYHTADPVNLTFPSAAGGWSAYQCDSVASGICTFTAPGDSAASSFTAADFAAVQKQLSVEVLYLTNALTFLVTGSTNLKDVVAAGNANVGLALTSAASTILGSKFVNNQQVPPQTQVTVSWQAVLGLIGSVASAAADAEGVGELLPIFENAGKPTQKAIKASFGAANTIGSVLEAVVSGKGLKNTSTTSPAPNPYMTFTTTIGELANSDLQSQLLVGFDVLADNITSDWGRLSAIGPRVTNVDDNVFYAPNQISQNVALDALTNSSSQAFYFALLPSFYHIDYWPAIEYTGQSGFQPKTGSLQGKVNPQCHAFYLNPNTYDQTGTLTLYQGMWTYAFGGWAPPPFQGDEGVFDVYVIAGTSGNPKTSNTFIPSIDSDLAQILFAPDQLHIPMQLFIAANGPLTLQDASVNNPSGWSNDQVCDINDYLPDTATVSDPSEGSGRDVHGDLITTTTLTSATSNTLGQDTVLTAVVKAGDQPVPGGSVYFTIDGVVVGKATVGADGTATLTLPEATLGKHAVQADYSSPDGYAVSSSTSSTLGVYAGTPDLTIAAASTSLDVSYDKPSAPLAVTIGSVAGMAGNVQLSCAGLPAGMSCSFDTSSPTLAADGSVKVSVVIGPSAATEAALGLLLLPMLLVGWRREEGWAKRRMAPAVLALCLATTALTGCGGGSSSSVTRETGTKTVLINAAVGGVSRSVAIDVNIQ